MKKDMNRTRTHLVELLEEHELTAGMCVRVHGDHLIIGRDAEDPDDRVRFTRLSAHTYGLSVKRHTGRWERTPFSGTMSEMVETIRAFMQHLIAVC